MDRGQLLMVVCADPSYPADRPRGLVSAVEPLPAPPSLLTAAPSPFERTARLRFVPPGPGTARAPQA